MTKPIRRSCRFGIKLFIPDRKLRSSIISGAAPKALPVRLWDLVFVRMGEDGNPEKGKAFVYDEFFRRLMGPIKRIMD